MPDTLILLHTKHVLRECFVEVNAGKQNEEILVLRQIRFNEGKAPRIKEMRITVPEFRRIQSYLRRTPCPAASNSPAKERSSNHSA